MERERVPFLFSVIATSGLSIQNVSSSERPAYHVLEADTRPAGPAGSGTGYVLSVDRYLDRHEVEGIICHVVKTRTAESPASVRVAIYYKLAVYTAPAGIPSLEKPLADRALAYYTWNANSPQAQQRLVLVRTGNGDVLKPPLGYDFDHKKNCD